MKFSSIVAVFALSVTGIAHAQNAIAPPAEINLPESVEPIQSQKPPVRGVTIDDFHVAFEETTLKQARAALGMAPVGQRGDAGDSLSWICYTLPALHARIWLESDEMGGGETIMEMTAKPIPPTETGNQGCPVPTTRGTGAFIDNGIWLGDSLDKIENLLGTSGKASESLRYYWHDSPEDKDGFVMESILLLRIEGGKVTEIQANQVTSN